MIRKSHGVAFAALALAATGAFAQSSVNLYGIVDAGFGSFHTFDTTSGKVASHHNTQINNGLMDASFIGFKGSEDLGGGTKAIFSIESYLDVTTGAASGGGDRGITVSSPSTSNFWGRNTNVGLSGSFGTVTLGHTDSLAYQAATSFNAFQSSDYFGVARLAFDPISVGSTPVRTLEQGWSKVATYTSPDLSGFNLGVQYAPKSDNAFAGANWGLSGTYAAGPLGLNATYEELKRPYLSGSGQKDKVWLLNGSYDFSVVKAYLQYGENKFTDAAPNPDQKSKLWDLGVSAPVGASGTLMAAYAQRKDTTSGVAGSNQIRDFSIGYDYSLSKRTFVYAAGLNERLKITGSSKSANTVAVGIHHTF